MKYAGTCHGRLYPWRHSKPCIDYGHCLHHDASTTRDFVKFWRLITKNDREMEIAIMIKFMKSTTTKNPVKFKQNYNLQVRSNSQISLCFMILILKSNFVFILKNVVFILNQNFRNKYIMTSFPLCSVKQNSNC